VKSAAIGLAGLAALAALALTPAARAACDIVVPDIEGLALAVENPANEVICLGGDIVGTLDLGFGALYEDRNFEIRSQDPLNPVTWSADPGATAYQSNLIVCDPEAKVTLRLHDMILDGEGYPAIALVANLCSLQLEGLVVRDFQPDAGVAALELPGDPPRPTEITRCWFEDIRGGTIHAYGGLLELTQSVFVGGHAVGGGGAVHVGGNSQTASQGNLFWGNSSEDGGGAFVGEEGAYLLSVGDAFVANRAPRGGAILWQGFSLDVEHGVFAGNATCEPGPDCQLDPSDLVSAAQAPDPSCNFSALDTGALELPDLEAAAGLGAAVALTEDVQKAAFTKNLFLGNNAGGGNGGALAWIRTAPDSPSQGGVPNLRLFHNTLVGNKAGAGGAFWGAESNRGMFMSVGNLWLDHASEPVLLEGAGWDKLLAANHVDGPGLLPDTGGPVFEMNETWGEEPTMEQCPAGCGDASLEALCGADDDSIELAYAYRPHALHFGHELCPVAGDPWVDETGLGLPELMMPDGSTPDRGLTGLPCLEVSVADQDGDGTPDFADCDPSNPGVNPFEVEICNGLDDNCNGTVDEEVTQTFYWDHDGDGYGGEAVEACSPEDRMVDNHDDCDDGNGEVHPGSDELHGDQLDNDCDGTVDLDAPGCHSAGCLATRMAPGDHGLELSGLAPAGPVLSLLACWRLARRRPRGG
jgi:hypothetical protein